MGRDWIDSVTFHRIIGPRVVEVAFSGRYSPKPQWGQRPLVVGLSESLRALRFYGDYRFDLSRLYPVLLEALPRLEVLYAPTSLPVGDDVSRRILSSCVLQELEVGNLAVDFRRCLSLGTPFPLRHFGLKIEGLEECDEVWAALPMSRLQSIKVHYSDEAEFPLDLELLGWFELVSAYSSTMWLTKIEYDGPWNYLPDDLREEYRITVQTLEPLLQFWNLEELVITSPTGFHLNNQALRLFARS